MNEGEREAIQEVQRLLKSGSGNEAQYANHIVVDNNLNDISIRFFRMNAKEMFGIFDRKGEGKDIDIGDGVDPTAIVTMPPHVALLLAENLCYVVLQNGKTGRLPPASEWLERMENLAQYIKTSIDEDAQTPRQGQEGASR